MIVVCLSVCLSVTGGQWKRLRHKMLYFRLLSQRRYKIINILVTFVHTNACHHIGVSPYNSCAEAKKLRDPPGIPISNVIVLITDHSHIFFVWGSWGITLENCHWSLLCKIYGDKSADTTFLFEHVIISYLLLLLRFRSTAVSVSSSLGTSYRRKH